MNPQPENAPRKSPLPTSAIERQVQNGDDANSAVSMDFRAASASDRLNRSSKLSFESSPVPIRTATARERLNRAGRFRFLSAFPICLSVSTVIVLMLNACGCSRDVRLSGRKLRAPNVRAVVHYGLNLDTQAAPEQVAYAALRAIHDDFRAANREAREEALDRQFDLAAGNEIVKQNRTGLSQEEYLFKVVNHWTPSISHYVNRFPTEWESAKSRLIRRDFKSSDGKTAGAEVLLEVDDPSGELNARAVVVVWLVQDTGFWRVTHVGFLPGKRVASVKTASGS